jgi:hypothetical protein
MPILEEIGYVEAAHNSMVASCPSDTIEVTIRALAKGYGKLYGVSLEEINSGLCKDFAMDVCGLCRDADYWWDDEIDNTISDPSHCVVVFGGRYYDAESPEGVDDFRQLPYILRMK